MGTVADIIGGIMSLAGGICFGVSMGTAYWYTIGSFNYGLFEFCSNGASCRSIGFGSDDPLRIVAPKVLMISAAVLLGIGLIFHLIAICCEQSARAGLTMTGSGFYIFASILILSAPAVMLGLVELDNTVSNSAFGGLIAIVIPTVYGYSFSLAWVAGSLLFVSSIIMCCSACTSKSQQTNVGPTQVVWSAQVPQPVMMVTQTNPVMMQQAVIPEQPYQDLSQQPNVQW